MLKVEKPIREFRLRSFVKMRPSTTSAVVVTLHGVRDNAASAEVPQDSLAARYTISVEQLEHLLNQVFPEVCRTVHEFIGESTGNFQVLTFDDGLISDFTTIFPRLLSRQIRGTFFVTANHVGQDGFTSLPQLREMIKANMEIGSHGLTHRYLITMPRGDAVRELRESKQKLEEMLGEEIVSFAPVGGHFRPWMLDVAEEAGYRSFATMIPGRTIKAGNLLLIRRNHVQTQHSGDYVSRLLRGHRGVLLANRLQYCFLKQLKNGLGLRNYDRLKSVIVRDRRNALSKSAATEE